MFYAGPVTTSWSNSDSLRRHLASFPVASVSFNIREGALRSVWIVNQDPSKYSVSCGTAHMAAIHSPCVVSYAISALVSNWDQCLTGFPGPSSYFCNTMHTTCFSQPLLSTVYLPFVLGSHNIGGDSIQCCRVSSASFSVLCSLPNWKG